MLCSVPTGRSGGSSWLDRLRSTKGFPSGEDDLDLDHFLSQNPGSASSNSLPPPPISSSESNPPPQNPRREPQWAAGVVSNILSELFFVGGSAENSKLSGVKLRRKQTNPRLYVGSSDNGGGNGNSNSSFAAAAAADSDQIKKTMKSKKITKMKLKIKKKKMKMKQKRSNFAAKFLATVNSDSHSLTQSNQEINVSVDSDEEEEEEEEEELRGYSRSEVTVIDTSFEDWKSEKLVFRKKNVWKIRAKRIKSRSSGKKKRKHGGDNHYDGGDEGQPARALTDCKNGDQSLQKHSLHHNVSREEEGREKVSEVSLHNLGDHFKKRSKKMKMGGLSSSLLVVAKGSKMEYKAFEFS